MIVLSFALHIWSSPRSAPAPLQRKSSNFATAWAASFFFLRSEALSLVCFHTSSLSAQLCTNEHALWRKKRTAVPQNPNPSHKETKTKLNDHRRRGNKHISHNKHRRHIRPSLRLKLRPVLRFPQQIPPRKTTATLQVFSFPENFEICLAVFVRRLLGNLPNGNTYFPRYFQRILQFSDANFHIVTVFWDFSILLAVFSKATLRLPSRLTGLLPPWMTANFAAATAFSGSSRGSIEEASHFQVLLVVLFLSLLFQVHRGDADSRLSGLSSGSS